jgi:two-component system heavy metal sensor histidine kinase CusS
VRSLRGRLTVWLLVGMGLLLTAGGLVLSRVISSQLHRDYDAALIAKARSLETLTEEQGDKIWLEFSDKIMPEFERRENPDYFQLWRRNGPVLERSRSLGMRDLPRSGGRLDRPVLSDLVLPDGRRGRRVEISFHPRSEELEEEDEREGKPGSGSEIAAGGPMATLTVAHSREDLDALLASVQVALTLVVLGLLGGTALLVKTVVGIGLAPLDRLAHRLESMGTESLGERLAVADAPRELAPMIRHLNGLLARLQESFARERAFSANLAHELRTPLAELRAVTDVALKWPEDSSSWTASCAEIRDIGLQMETLVANLLALARSETKGQASEVPLHELAASCWAAVSAEAEAKGMAFCLEIPDGLTIVSDREKLTLILSNLFANAVAYGSPGYPVTCSASAARDGFALGVRNSTADLAPEDLPRLFDRFWRKDAARSDGRHTGLGLALVAALCESLKLQKEARLDGGSFEIILRGSLESPRIAEPQQRGMLVVVADRAE